MELRLVLAGRDGPRDVVATIPPGSTVADLLAAVGESAVGTRAWVDDRPVDPDWPVERAGIPHGATLSTRRTAPPVVHPHAGPVCPTSRHGAIRVAVVAGIGTGRAVRVHPGATTTVGRADDNDLVVPSPTVSAHHCTLHLSDTAVTVVDRGSHNGTWVGGEPLVADRAGTHELPTTLRVGAVVVRVDRADGCDAPRGHDLGGTSRPVHRPPRPRPPDPPDPVAPPAPAATAPAAPVLRWAGILAPLALGGAMVAMTGSLRFALFALLSPVMALGNWWSSRRQGRRAGREAARTHDAELARFRADLARARADERLRREAALPDLDRLVHRACEPSRRLWERRPDHPDALLLRWGSGDVAWAPPLATRAGDRPDPSGSPGDATPPVAVEAVLHDLPVPLDLARVGVVGIVGPPGVRRDLARSLVLQAAVLHGPADLALGIAATPVDWDWVAWLPHRSSLVPTGPAVDRPGSRDRAPTAAPAAAAAPPATGSPAVAPGRTTLVVADADRVAAGATGGVVRRATREMASRPSRRGDQGGPMLVLADHVDQLPASWAVVVATRGDGTGRLVRGPDPSPDPVALALADTATARRVARALARCTDPEEVATSGPLPRRVGLADLLVEAGPVTAGDRLATPVGVTRGGAAVVDLVADGPHALVAGTTGSGKSELLRSLVVGLATRHTPDEVVFVLVDYKGGSAFRTCARLPHAVGLVTDLDQRLGERALVSLRAELRHRERVLADLDLDDLAAHRAAGCPGEPLPRLVVVVDEFATLATELPDFLDALVGVAQRGRSLGLHLVLATQRPRGCISPEIRANTNLRMALRVQGEDEARDVLGDPRPAHLDPDRPGHAWLRRGSAEPIELQVAHAAQPPTDERHLRVADLHLAGSGSGSGDDARAGADHLDTLVDACRRRARDAGRPPPRRPWLPPLADRIRLVDLWRDGPPEDGTVVLGLADLPDAQTQQPARWRPDEGHLLLVGRRGSGVSTALATVAAGVVGRATPDQVHLHVVDDGTGTWKAAGALAHVGSVVDGHDHDDVGALLDWLLDEARRRRGARRVPAPDDPRIVLVVDGLATLLEADDPRTGAHLADRLARLLDDGPAVGIVVVAGTERAGGIPARIRVALARRVVLRVDERDRAMLDVPPDWAPSVPGRALDDDGTEVQVAEPPGWDDLLERGTTAPGTHRPHRVVGLPDRATLDDLPAPNTEGGLWLPIGTARDARPAALHLRAGDHAIVAGPPRSGRTSVLQVLAAQVRRASPQTRQVAICDEDRSALHGWTSLDAAIGASGMQPFLSAMRDGSGPPWLLLVDDVRLWNDLDGIDDVVRACPHVTVVVAGRPDDLRGPFGGWLRSVRASRSGILLQPDLALDGDLLDVRLPRHLSTPLGPGRGMVVDAGTAVVAQLALPPDDPSPGGIATT